MSNDDKIDCLTFDQAFAVMPRDQIWLSASAGTGKTQVLSARVIRLLLDGAATPESLLCITFTKAGAAEMASRINSRLASWVQMDKDRLALELQSIGADISPKTLALARMLFANILDAPGGGLRIMTIHSLCQSLLASFPEEAGLLPGFQSLEGREEAFVKRQALADMIMASQNAGQSWLLENLRFMSLEMGEKPAQAFLENCAKCPDAMRQIPDDRGAQIFARRFLEISHDGTADDFLRTALVDSAIDKASIEAVAAMNREWGSKTGETRARTINTWLESAVEDRVSNLNALHFCWTKKNDGVPQTTTKGQVPQDPSYASFALSMHEWTKSLIDQYNLLKYADRLGGALLVGKAYAASYQAAKTARGLLDFDDLIRNAANMLQQPEMSAWIRYKLDQRIDHILIDEAQDTNQAQWDIVNALADDFFSGMGAKSGRNRTIFAVGDYKQAIFGFQGTDPKTYRDAGQKFSQRIAQSGASLNRVELAKSFRSSQVVLNFVNAVVEGVGNKALGLADPVECHTSDKPDIGCVELLSLVSPEGETADNGSSDPVSQSEEGWLSSEKRRLAYRIARYVRRLYDEKPILSSTGKPLRAGDVMILLRSRTELASAIVAQLHAVGVPVAGIDRMKIREPIVVKDLMAVIRFALQPNDDLNLAALLVSPLFGWSQEQLLEFGYRGKNIRLWRHLRDQDALKSEIGPLRKILAQSDFSNVYQFLENILSGEMAGRSKLTGRLGNEVLVPIEELLNKALEFEQSDGGTLQSFLAWFEAGETQIKREGETGSDAVRVMTVHGAKGLQAPVVILADIASDPRKQKSAVQTKYPFGDPMPLLPINKSMRIGRLEQIIEEQEVNEQAEHLRLLYVAITRAEERLILAGSMKSKEAPEFSWYPKLQSALVGLGCEWNSQTEWGPGGSAMRISGALGIIGAPKADKLSKKAKAAPEDMPDWLYSNPPEESLPPRPLSPTRIDDDQYGEIPASASLRLAGLRGKLIHGLFERMFGDDPSVLLEQARNWLKRNNQSTQLDNERILRDVARIVSDDRYRDYFGPNARAEVPIAAVVGTQVISGRIDRMIVGDDFVRVIDFKTGRYVPAGPDEVAVPLLRQMAYYVAALQVIFPNHRIEAALLFTSGPMLIDLPDSVLAGHKPA